MAYDLIHPPATYRKTEIVSTLVYEKFLKSQTDKKVPGNAIYTHTYALSRTNSDSSGG
jgi:hypothetical protein